MKFLLKYLIFSAIASIIVMQVIETKQEKPGNNAAESGSGVTMLASAIQSGLNLISPKQPEKALVRRVCKIKPNSDEECRNITTE